MKFRKGEKRRPLQPATPPSPSVEGQQQSSLPQLTTEAPQALLQLQPAAWLTIQQQQQHQQQCEQQLKSHHQQQQDTAVAPPWSPLSPRGDFLSTTSSSQGEVTKLLRGNTGGLSARIQAAQLAAAGTFDPAVWAAAAAEAIQADQEAAVEAARRERQEEEERRRAQQRAVVEVATAARASRGGGSESDGGAWPSSGQQQSVMSPGKGRQRVVAVAPLFLEEQMQQAQQQPQQGQKAISSGAMLPAWSPVPTTPTQERMEEQQMALQWSAAAHHHDAPPATAVSSAAAAGAAALAAATASYSSSHTGHTVLPGATITATHLGVSVHSQPQCQPDWAGTSLPLAWQQQALQAPPSPGGLVVHAPASSCWSGSAYSSPTAASQRPQSPEARTPHSMSWTASQHTATAAMAQQQQLLQRPVSPLALVPQLQQHCEQQQQLLLMQRPVSPLAFAPQQKPQHQCEQLCEHKQQQQQQQQPPPAPQACRRSPWAACLGGKQAGKATGQAHTRRRGCCLVAVLLLLVVAGVGVGKGVWLGLQRRSTRQVSGEPPSIVAAPSPLIFQAIVAAPAASPPVACARWFGTPQRLEQFGAVFSAAYASALSLPPSHFAVDAVQCGGQAMQALPGGSVGNSSTLAGPARALLREALAQQSGGRWLLQEPSRSAPQQQQPTQLAPTKSAGARQTQADVAARFRIPAPDGLADRLALRNAVLQDSARILPGPLSSLFGVQVAFKSVELIGLDGSADGGASTQHDNSEANAKEVTNRQQQQQQVPAPGQQAPATRPRPVAAPPLPPPPPDPIFDAAAECSGLPLFDTAVMDGQGRLWGWENWQTCAFRSHTTVQPQAPNAAWEVAPLCRQAPTALNPGVLDAAGLRWGWQDGASCAHRTAGGRGLGADADAATAAARSPPTWLQVPPCSFPPSSINSVADASGNLWGWQDNASCGFKGSYSDVSDALGSVSWAAAPACQTAPSTHSAVLDIDGRWWGWQGGVSCALRPSRN